MKHYLFLKYLEKCVDHIMAILPRCRPSVGDLSGVCLVAHRGAHDKSLDIIENTVAAFDKALEYGCGGIEFDIHACMDDTLIINHDPTLERIWGYSKQIQQLRFTELRALVPTIPTLTEIVSRYGKRMHLFIELKAPFTAIEALATTLQPLTPCEDYHLISLDEHILPRLTPFPKKALMLIPVHDNVRAFCQKSMENAYGGILGQYLLLTNKHILRLKEAQQLIGVGFVDSKYSLYRELHRGLSLFFSNNVAEVSRHLRDLV